MPPKVGLDDFFAMGRTNADLQALPRLDLDALEAADTQEDAGKPSQATLIVEIATAHFELGVDQDGNPFLVANEQPSLALMFRGSERVLKSQLSRTFYESHGRVPNSSAMTDALMTLAGQASTKKARHVYLRVARMPDGSVVLDLGRHNGEVVVIQPAGWNLTTDSPVLFRRTGLTGEIPRPQRGERLESLKQYLNITQESWPLVLGWLVAALLEDIPHAILLLRGEKGTGKTTAGRLLVILIDPSPAPVRAAPSGPRQWAITTAASYGFVVDNISSIRAWWSDALCKAATGDGWVDRSLFTDSDIAYLRFRRIIALTSIDPGALRGDLADRLLSIELDPIPETERRPEKELLHLFEKARPGLLGALLDLVCAVLAALPTVNQSDLPRMADFGRVLAAVDQVLGCRSLDSYLRQLGQLEQDVLEDDAIGNALLEHLEAEGGHWSGTATDLLEAIRPEDSSRGWPKSGRGLSGALKKIMPALRTVGIRVEFGRDTSRKRNRIVTISTNSDQPSGGVGGGTRSADGDEEGCGRSSDDCGRSASDNRPPQNGPKPPIQAHPDGSDGSDGLFSIESEKGGPGPAMPSHTDPGLGGQPQDRNVTVRTVRTVRTVADQPSEASCVGRLEAGNRPQQDRNRPHDGAEVIEASGTVDLDVPLHSPDDDDFEDL